MPRLLHLAVLLLALAGCSAKMTLIDRSDGKMYSGSTDGTTVSGAGSATLFIDGETYVGPWIYQPNGGTFGFSNFNATSTGSATGSASTPKGNVFASVTTTGQVAGTSTNYTTSVVGNGMINARASTGQFIRCVFTFNVMQNTGIGECIRNDGRVYDMMLKR